MKAGTGTAKKPKKNKSGFSTAALVLIFLIGLSLLLYPTVADWWNSLHQTRAIATYAETVAGMSSNQYDEIWETAVAYNESLAASEWRLNLETDEKISLYEGILNVNGTGMMGYIEIPKISVYLPIYHGTSDAILARNIGHIDGTSLPVGGESTHTVLSGHRGLTSARLFTDIDQLVTGDTFMIHVLNEVLTYEVDQILVVEPGDVSSLRIIEGEDLCTLVTCTPYGVNTHRLLVRGHRIDTADTTVVHVTGDAFQLSSSIIAPIVAAPVLLLLLIVLLWTTSGRRAKPHIDAFDISSYAPKKEAVPVEPTIGEIMEKKGVTPDGESQDKKTDS